MSDPNNKTSSNDPSVLGDGRLPSSSMRSYALLTNELKQLYMNFYKATYGKSKLDIKTKEFVAPPVTVPDWWMTLSPSGST